jgi:hypothetical protein
MRDQVEAPVNLALLAGRNVWYEVTPNYGPPSGPLYPTSISVTAQSLASTGNFTNRDVPNLP